MIYVIISSHFVFVNFFDYFVLYLKLFETLFIKIKNMN